MLDDDFVRSHLGAQTGPHIVLTISDTGMGISPEIQDHIFEPFFTTRQHEGGTGMGLATVYGIVRSHKGIISVYSETDRGTSFKLYFPGSSGQPEEQVVDRETSQSLHGATILLIDDEPTVREMWGDFLSQKGYRVIMAEDGLQGIERFSEPGNKIDLVILDMIMPRLGGRETLAALKKIDPSVKVLVTSGYSENGQAGEIVHLGIDGFLQKPCRLTILEKEITGILRK
jgi:two-component system cell cycle sensor histidine kinase/response regulator CckA